MQRFPISIALPLSLLGLLVQVGCGGCPRALGALFTPALVGELRDRPDQARPDWSIWLSWRGDEASLGALEEVCHD